MTTTVTSALAVLLLTAFAVAGYSDPESFIGVIFIALESLLGTGS